LRRAIIDRATNAQPIKPSTTPPDGTMMNPLAYHIGVTWRVTVVGCE